jgi:hypothetical protein
VRDLDRILDRFDPNPLLSSHIRAIEHELLIGKSIDDRPLPSWDGRILRFLGKACKSFRTQPAPSQRTILNAFEEDGWPNRIDDPLTCIDNAHPSQRLKDAVFRLNERLRHLRFYRDGRKGIGWEQV